MAGSLIAVAVLRVVLIGFVAHDNWREPPRRRVPIEYAVWCVIVSLVVVTVVRVAWKFLVWAWS